MAKNQTLLYAAATDVRLALSRLEALQPFQYTRTGMFKQADPAVFRSFRDIPDLGLAPHPTAIANPGYLLSLPGETVAVRDVRQKAGGVLFAVDQQANPNTVHLRPGGQHGDDVILSGALGTASTSAHSVMLFGIVSKLLRQVFTPVE